MRRLIVLLAFATAAYGQSDRSWSDPVAPFRIHGNIYYVGAADLTSFLIATPKGHILIDGGVREMAPTILANIRKLGFEPRDVRFLLSSHAHFDHAAGLSELKRATGATFFSSAEDLPAHARGGLDDPQFGNRFPYEGIMADRIVHDRQRVTLGETTLIAHITPGHTRGCTTWTTRAGGRDVVFFCSPSIPSEYRIVGNPRYPDAVADYRRQFERLTSLPCELFLASHGSFFDLSEKTQRLLKGEKEAFVDPEGCSRFVQSARERFEKVAAEQATGGMALPPP